ncbi:hypothetical protein ACFUV1_08590 [Streptomyces griseoincarnatus]
MPSFQTEDIPHGFAFDEAGKIIHPRYVRVIVTPPPEGPTFGWKRFYLSFGASFGDAKVRVGLYKGGTWTTQILDVTNSGGKVGLTIETGTEKVSVGRMKTSANDRDDDIPLSWLLESQA